jgi:hypothetical protein
MRWGSRETYAVLVTVVNIAPENVGRLSSRM